MSEADDTRREYLWERYGRPESVDRKVALEALGITDVDPSEVIAFRYKTREAADAYAAANLEHYGHPTLGTYSMGPAGVVGVLDLRAAIKDMRERLHAEVERVQLAQGDPAA